MKSLTYSISQLISLSLAVCLISLLSACGPRYKTPQMVTFEQRLQTPELKKLRTACPDLINDSLKYYQKAKELHEDNEPEESEYYVTLARITWQTAEKRASYQSYRVEMSKAKARFESAQALLNDSLRRKDSLMKMRAQQQNLMRNANLEAERTRTQQGEALTASYKEALAQAKASMKMAQEMRAPEFAPGPFKKGEIALRSSEASAQRADLINARRIAEGATMDFKAAMESARPAFEKEKQKQDLTLRMKTLVQEGNLIDSGNASLEPRGVVLSLTGLHRKAKLRRNANEVLDQVARLVDKYSDLRIIIEGHTNAYGNTKQKKTRTERMAREFLDQLKARVSQTLKVTTLGRGDYAPMVGNAKSIKNIRIDVVFFKPRL